MHRPFSAIASVAVLVLLLAPAAVAKSPRTVDMATLTPPLNPTFSWNCFDTGAGPVCHGTREEAYENEDIGFECAGETAWLTGSGRAVMTRWHTADGRATKTVLTLGYVDYFSLSTTGDGPRVTVRSNWNRHFAYGVPGDVSTRVLTELGAVYHATAPGHGVLFHDVGLIRFAPGGDEDIEVMRGPHDLYASDFEALDRMCDVLAP